MLPVYVPAEAGLSQSGESFSRQVVALVPVFVNCAAHPPVCPPATRVSVIPLPEAFQPVVSVSKPGFLTKFTLSEAVLVLPESFPVTVCAPADVAVQLAPVHDPSGAIEKVVNAVTSPSELFEASKPCAA
jgi:hypothetical protein